jgi:hypothetical protein
MEIAPATNTFFDRVLLDQFIARFPEISLYNINELLTLFSKNRRQKRLNTILNTIMGKTCQNNIGVGYRTKLSNELPTSKTHEIILISNSKKVPEIEDDFQGFMIVEKGECNTFPEIHCLNLICSKNQFGRWLIALYLYITIKRGDDIGLLELGNAYYNVGGLCLYTKYGFKFAPDLSKEDCFKYFTPNLPMKVEVKDYGATEEEQIARLFRILTNTEINDESFTKPTICGIRGNRQKLLSLALNLQVTEEYVTREVDESKDKYLWEYQYGRYLSPYETSDGTIIDYNKLLNIIKTTPAYGNIDSFIELIQNDTINEDVAGELLTLVIQYPQTDAPVEPANRKRGAQNEPEPVASRLRSLRSRHTGGRKTRKRKYKRKSKRGRFFFSKKN